jgi:AcrR family transcriptional regulator
LSAPQVRRSDTRERIQDVALRLFGDQGYEGTSLREIAEELSVTKAALYYHFKTKEDILVSLFNDVAQPLDELIEWGRQQPRTSATKLELLRRYSEGLAAAAPLFLFLQENQATLRELTIGRGFRDRMAAMSNLVMDPDAPLTDQIRCLSALYTLHFGTFAAQTLQGDPEEKRAALLSAATDLIASVHSPPS